eukprot:scaffold19674_cov101-Isochrysis_galbana.AAC.1
MLILLIGASPDLLFLVFPPTPHTHERRYSARAMADAASRAGHVQAAAGAAIFLCPPHPPEAAAAVRKELVGARALVLREVEFLVLTRAAARMLEVARGASPLAALPAGVGKAGPTSFSE